MRHFILMMLLFTTSCATVITKDENFEQVFRLSSVHPLKINVLSFDQMVPLGENGQDITIENNLVYLAAEEKGQEFFIGYNISNLTPKRQDNSCPLFQEKLTPITGISDGEEEKQVLFFNAIESYHSFPTYFGIYKYSPFSQKISHQIFQIGQSGWEESHLAPTTRVTRNQNLPANIKRMSFIIGEDTYLHLIETFYAYEQTQKPDLKDLKLYTGVFTKAGKSYVVRGQAQNQGDIMLFTYEYDSRIFGNASKISIQILPKLSIAKITNSEIT